MFHLPYRVAQLMACSFLIIGVNSSFAQTVTPVTQPVNTEQPTQATSARVVLLNDSSSKLKEAQQREVAARSAVAQALLEQQNAEKLALEHVTAYQSAQEQAQAAQVLADQAAQKAQIAAQAAQAALLVAQQSQQQAQKANQSVIEAQMQAAEAAVQVQKLGGNVLNGGLGNATPEARLVLFSDRDAEVVINGVPSGPIVADTIQEFPVLTGSFSVQLKSGNESREFKGEIAPQQKLQHVFKFGSKSSKQTQKKRSSASKKSKRKSPVKRNKRVIKKKIAKKNGGSKQKLKKKSAQTKVKKAVKKSALRGVKKSLGN
jgi:hypothetical protein